MNKLASVLVFSLVLLLCGTGYGWAAHTHAHVSISDNTNAVSDSDDDWGVTCSSLASKVYGSAQASSGASVTWDTSHPYFISKTTSTWTNTANTPGYTSSHDPTYANPYDYNIRLYGAGVVAGCTIWLDSIELVVPVGSPANFAIAELNVVVDGTSLAWGHFMLAGDGSFYGDGSYVDSFFDIFFEGDNWRAVYRGPSELSIELPVDTPLEFDFQVITDAHVDLPAVASRGISTHTVTFGVPDEFILVEKTLSADLSCEPVSGTVPFTTQMAVTLNNLYPGQIRRIAGRLNVSLANGTWFPNWRAGFTNVIGGDTFFTYWPQGVPAMARVIGDNTFDLVAEDVTPAPYNQPPYPPAGDTATASCIVTAIAP